MKTVKWLWLGIVPAMLVACGKTRKPKEPSSSEVPGVCLVLSVGSEKGLSHLGVLAALHDHKVNVDCVAGNSMGALVGGLYVASPESDPLETYREVMKLYYKQTVRDASFFGVNVVDWERMRGVLREHFAGQRIESLSIDFLTGYQQTTSDGIRYEQVRGGLLADEVARSLRNPLLFRELKLNSDEPFDPGADRVSATPLDEACRTFPDKQFVVSNVTQSEAFVGRDFHCHYEELMVKSPVGETKEQKQTALMGEDPQFTALVQAGYKIAERKLPWRQLGGVEVPSTPLQFVRLKVKTTLAKTKSNGRKWDEGFFEGAAPEPLIRVSVDSCETCDVYATTLGELESKGQEGYSHEAEFVLRVRRGLSVSIEIADEDGKSDDQVGVLELEVDGPTSTTKDWEQGSVAVTLSRADEVPPG